MTGTNKAAKIANDLRRLNKQHVRKAIIDVTQPLRKLPLPVARPLGNADVAKDVAYSIRETGSFEALDVDFGTMMPTRPYDQESTVFRIDGGRCTFRNCHALDGDRRVLYQQDLPFGHLPVALKKLDPVVATYPSVAYLSNTWVTNYYHWLILVLPMLRYYQEANIDVERVYIGEPLKSWQQRSLEFAGITEDMVITEPCTAEVGHVAMLTRHIGGVSPEQIRWVRSLFVKDELAPGNRRLFVGRGDVVTRRMFDEDVLASTLEREFDFEYLTTSGMTFDEEIEVFGQASAVVAPYGAAITNTLFSPKGTQILELTAFDHDFSLAHCYQEMSAAIGLQHASLRGQQTPRRKNGAYSDIKMPIEQVLREVEKMLKSEPNSES